MEKMNLKSSLFGYTKQSVLDYILDMDNEYKRKTGEAAAAQKSMQNTIEKLKAEVSGFAEETDRLVDELTEKDERLEKTMRENGQLCQKLDELAGENQALKKEIAELKSIIENKKKNGIATHGDEMSDHEADQITGVLFEAKRFANELKRKAEREYLKACSDNLAKLEIQKKRTSDYAKRIDALCKTVHNLCDNLDGELCCVKKSLERAASEDVFGDLEDNEARLSMPETVSERIRRLGL